MKPPPFDYVRAASLAEAVAVLAADEDAKVLAGGQSLLPLLALRLARPTVLVDIADLGLDTIAVDAEDGGSAGGAGGAGVVRIGATVRQRRLELDDLIGSTVPLLAEAAAQVGYPATRNRGTIGGSLAHADPVAEIPAVAVALGGSIVAFGPRGERTVLAADLADGFFTTTLAPDEILTEVRLPIAGGRQGAAWCEWSPRAHDFAHAGVGVVVELDAGGSCRAVGAAACGIGATPLALAEPLAAAGVVGAPLPGPALLAAVATAVEAACAGTADDRDELTGLLAARALASAWSRAAATAWGAT